MATKTTVPFSFFPRFGFTPSHKVESSSRSPHTEKPNEDWYIPYNGPFEPPKTISIPKQPEDSLGYHLREGDMKSFLEDSRLLDRYKDVSIHSTSAVGLGRPPPQSTRFPGSRLPSDLTGRTTSSSTVMDRTLPHPQQLQASVSRLQVHTHTATDASGNVGESPMPIQRTIMSTPPKRTSRFFGFGTSKRPKGQPTSIPLSYIARSTVPESCPPSAIQHNTIQDNGRFAKHPNSSDDPFDSHYSTFSPPSHSSHIHHYYQHSVDNINQSPSKRHPLRYLDQRGTSDKDSLFSSSAMNHNSPTVLPAHPYANTSSSTSLQTAHPTTSRFVFQTAGTQRSYEGEYSKNPTHRGRTLTYAIDTHMNGAAHTPHLKSSVSTPNLSEVARGKQPAQPRTKSPRPATGIGRWLSAETWCDALFFPRPRLKLGGSSGRIVSPPDTPISEDAPPRPSPAILGGRPRVFSATTHDKPGSRVLLKSRSTFSGRPRTAPTLQQFSDREMVLGSSSRDPEPVSTLRQQEVRPPSPVPSLTQVLQEGEALAEQRKQWQNQASRSLGNSRTRSLSRARAKSLSRDHGRPGHKPEGSTALEFLATRTLLGGQSIAPTISVGHTSHSRSFSSSHTISDIRARSNSYSFSHSRSHSHSHSLGNTSSQHSTRHTRNESWSKNALLKACAPCGDRSDLCGSPVSDKAPANEFKTVDNHGYAEGDLVIIKAISPAPSTQSGEGVGIALSFPPCADDSRPAHGLEGADMSDHPYATGAIYSKYYSPPSTGQSFPEHNVSDYAGPHPSAYDPQLPPTTSDMSMRHRLPPRAVQPGTIPHPYASAFCEPAGLGARRPSNLMLSPLPVPPSAVQEGKDFTSNHHISISSPSFEKYGVGEALVFAAPSRDEQDGDSVDQPLGPVIPSQKGTLDRIVEVVKARDLAIPSKLLKGSVSRPPSVTLIVSTRPPTPTATEGRDAAPQPSPTTNISSAHLVISALDNNDDLGEFQDLFYRPPQRSSEDKQASDTSRGIPSDIHTSYSGSALTNLVRSLSEEMEELNMAASDTSLGHRSRGSSALRSDELSQSHVSMDMSRTSSPAPISPPVVLRLPSQHYDAPFELGIPEDIPSSRASSILMTEENDTFGHPIRQGLVDAAGISTILQCPSRATSTHPEIQEDAEEATAITPISYIDSRLRSPDCIRSSYMTSASEYSRMSGLSDFPVPPAQLDHTSIIQVSADVPSTSQLQTDCNPRFESLVFNEDNRRATFGGGGMDHYSSTQV